MANRRQAEPRKRDRKAAQESACALAVAALTFIAADPERLGRFLALSGIGPHSIRAAASDPGFLRGVLDHMVGDEALLLAFANAHDIDPHDVAQALRVLAAEDRQ